MILNGGKIYAINPVAYAYHFDIEDQEVVSPQEIPMSLAAIILALAEDTSRLPTDLQQLLVGLTITPRIKTIARFIASVPPGRRR